MTTVPGYRVSIELFLPADPEQPRQMAQSAAQLDSLAEQLDRIGLPGATVSFRFVSRHRLPPSPPAAADPQAEPTQPLDNAPAETAEAGASEEQRDPPAAPELNDFCRHERQKRYGSGQVVCLDCQGVLAEGEAA